VINAGVDIIVAGTSIFKAYNPIEVINEMKKMGN
jgi:pentose-5-phosphate-3-epimerase